MQTIVLASLAKKRLFQFSVPLLLTGHELPAHHTAEAYLDAYIEAGNLGEDRKAPLLQSIEGKAGRLTGKGLSRGNAWDMVKRRAKAAGLSGRLCNHSSRATGITAYLENGGTLEKAQTIAAHESPRTTKRRSDEATKRRSDEATKRRSDEAL
jgi:site-specific recombinase XerD